MTNHNSRISNRFGFVRNYILKVKYLEKYESKTNFSFQNFMTLLNRKYTDKNNNYFDRLYFRT